MPFSWPDHAKPRGQKLLLRSLKLSLSEVRTHINFCRWYHPQVPFQYDWSTKKRTFDKGLYSIWVSSYENRLLDGASIDYFNFRSKKMVHLLNLKIYLFQWCTVDNTSMNPRLFREIILMIFSGSIYKVEIRTLPILASSFQGLSDEQIEFSLRPTQQLTLEKTWFWAIYWLILELQSSLLIPGTSNSRIS